MYEAQHPPQAEGVVVGLITSSWQKLWPQTQKGRTAIWQNSEVLLYGCLIGGFE